MAKKSGTYVLAPSKRSKAQKKQVAHDAAVKRRKDYLHQRAIARRNAALTPQKFAAQRVKRPSGASVRAPKNDAAARRSARRILTNSTPAPIKAKNVKWSKVHESKSQAFLNKLDKLYSVGDKINKARKAANRAKVNTTPLPLSEKKGGGVTVGYGKSSGRLTPKGKKLEKEVKKVVEDLTSVLTGLDEVNQAKANALVAKLIELGNAQQKRLRRELGLYRTMGTAGIAASVSSTTSVISRKPTRPSRKP